MSTKDDCIVWKVGDPRPPELAVDPLTLSILPKPTAWISVSDNEVALLEGYGMASHIAPTLMFSSDSLPPLILQQLKETKICTLSIATQAQGPALFQAARRDNETPPTAWAFEKLGLTPCRETPTRPPAVQTSPVHMHCRLVDTVELVKSQELILLEVETYLIRGSILSQPSGPMLKSGRKVLAKVDAELMQPVASMGDGGFVKVDGLHSMERPRRHGNADWESDPFRPTPTSDGPRGFTDIKYTYRDDQSNLGYNPAKALCVPRPIGWISTYRDAANHLSHVAPYSFFADVGRGLVAFSSYRSNADDSSKKDAQRDSETMGCFATNIVTKDLSVQMNYSSAPLKRGESEFDVGPGLARSEAELIDAPVVKDSPIITECRYLKTVDVASFSIIIGQVVGVKIQRNVLSDGKVDLSKLCPLTRLGYTDEYAVTSQAMMIPSPPQCMVPPSKMSVLPCLRAEAPVCA